MAATTENQNPSSSNGSFQIETLYDKFQKKFSIPSEEKSSRGKFKLSSIFKAARDDTSSSNTDQKRHAAAAAGSNGNATQNNTGEGSSSQSQKRKIPKTYSDPVMVRGFEYDEMSLEIMLLKGGRDDSFKTIGVVGPPGVGKTTLCKSILKNDRVKSSYGRMIWVTLSEKPNTQEELERTEVPEDIIEHISDEHELPQLLNNHNQQFEDNKYLLVIDDVGEREEDGCYETLKDCFSNKLPKEKGGAVIVTCRSEEAAKKMVGDQNLHRLQPLSNPRSCWLIYNDALKGYAEETEASKDAMEELMKRCGGLPGAARMMGEIKAKNIIEEEKRRAIQEKEKASMSWALLKRALFKGGKRRRELIKRIAQSSLDN